MGVGRSLLRAIISAVGGLFPLVFLSGSVSPLGGYLPNLLGDGSDLSNMVGAKQLASVLPFGAAGLTGGVIYMILQRVLTTAESLTYSKPSMPDMSAMMSSYQPGFRGMAPPDSGGMPKDLPAGMSRSQYLILRKYREGARKPKDVGRMLSMDNKEVERETASLKANGYLTKDNRLTSKGLDASY